MKKIYFNFKNKIGNYFLIILFANILLAEQDSSTYFERTVAHFKIQDDITNPFYESINIISLSSINFYKNYKGINPTNVLNKLKTEVKSGADESTFIVYQQYDGNDLSMPNVIPVDYYIENQINTLAQQSFKDEIMNNFTNTNSRNNYNDKSINILNKNLGNTNIMLALKGNIEINGELEFIDQQGGNLTQQGDKWNLDINQKQQFDLKGNIGQKLKVSADQNSESDFDFENSLLLQYKGFDNEIVDNVSAGNVSLNLPHTQLVSVGMGKREGLFGLKMESNFGNLNLSTILGREKVKKESFSLGEQADGLTKYDYQFVRDKYFFVDDVFKLFYYPLTEDHKTILNTHYVIKDFKLFKRSKSSEIIPGTYNGDAYLDPNDTNSHLEPGYWILLEDQNQGNDYSIDPFTGVVRLNTVSSTDVVAAHYTIGVFSAGNIVEVSDAYNATGTDITSITSQNDQCVNQIHYCDINNPLYEPLVACTDDIIDYNSVCKDEYGNIIDSITSSSDCISQQFINNSCLYYNLENNQYDIDLGINSYNDCVALDNYFSWGPPCDYINNDCSEEENLTDCNDYSPNKVILKLIKTAEPQNSTSKTWDLMLKNVYSLGTNRIDREDPPVIEIIHVGGQLGTETASATGKTFLNIFGLDNMDVNGDIVSGGDGKIDAGSYNIINEYGDLFLPFHMPFSYDEGNTIYDGQVSELVYGSQIDNVYWGNSNNDLDSFFDGTLNSYNSEVKDIVFDRLSSSGNFEEIEFEYTTYDDGPAMYYSDSQDEFTAEREFAIKINNINQNTTINLGFMIVEGSETLTDGNTVLIPNIDYRIDYFSGTLTLVSDKAKNSSETLNISYDRNEIVSFDQKLILGNYFKYDFSENSNLFGGAYAYKQDISDKKVDVGYEPMENFMWHIGGTYKKELESLNENINNNTWLNLDKPSKIEFLTEYAEINPNPNPLGVAYIDDFESSSMSTNIFENFSSWKLSTPPLADSLGALYDLKDRMKMFWFNPYEDINTNDIWENIETESNSKESTLWLEIPNCSNQGNYYNCPEDADSSWWSGITTYLISSEYNQIDKKYLDIWLNIEGQNGYPGLGENLNYENNMILNIDLGEVSEDINLNNKADTEDSPMNGVQIGNGTLEDNGSEDVGIDACTDEFEDGWGGCLCSLYNHYIEANGENVSNPYYNCNNLETQTFSELKEQIDNNSTIDNGTININSDVNDPNGDNFEFTYNSNNPDYTYFNGTEGNYEESIMINKEDFDDDNNLDKINSYFTYSIDLSREHIYDSTISDPNEEIKAGEASNGWVLYRIPLSSFNVLKDENELEPTWELIKNVRLWIEGTGSNNYGKIGIASIELVGNDWKNLGVIYSDQILDAGYQDVDYNYDSNLESRNGNIFLQVVNTHENDDYIPPPDVVVNTTQSSLDFNSVIKEKEQSLVVSFDEQCDAQDNSCGIGPNESAFIKKTFGFSSLDTEKQNSFFAYKNMEMYYKAINQSDAKFDSTYWVQNDNCNGDQVEIAFRFGKDNNYYEVRQKLDNNCSQDMSIDECDESWNNLNINLEELTRYKQFRTGLDYPQFGLDGCSNDHETGIYEVYNSMIIPRCLSETDIDNGLTFSNICNTISLNCDEEDEINTQECIDLISKININFCEIEDTHYTYENSLQHYRPNKFDPNGDDFQVPNEDCCLATDPLCSSDIANKICDTKPRAGIDCVLEEDNIDSCDSLPVCPDDSDFSSINESLLDIINVNQGELFYRGTENNYQYDCYFFDDFSWSDCSDYTDNEISSYNLSTSYDENLNLLGELVFDSSNNYLHYDVPPSQNEQYDIWTWDNQTLPQDLSLENVCGECSSLSIKGEPAINRIEYVLVGIVNDTSTPIYGSVWLNELRMSGVKKEKGTALLANMQFNLGELFDIDFSYSQQEANYHKLEKRLSAGKNKVNYSTSIGFNPHKLIEKQYFEMPLNIKYSRNISSPMYKTGSDIFLGTDIDLAPENEKTTSNKLNITANLKTNLSNHFNDNLFFSYFLDNGRLNYSYSKDKSSTPTILNKTNLSHRLDLSYNLIYSKNNYWEPFKKILDNENMKYDENDFLFKLLREFKIYYSPKDIQFNASYTDNSNFTEQRSSVGGTITDDKNINLNRDFKTAYSLSDNFLINYQISTRNNLNDYNNKELLNISKVFDFKFSPGIEKSKTEKFTFTYNPTVLDWLNPRFMYNPRYSWNRDLNTSADATADIKSENDFSASFTLSFQKLIEKIYEPDKKSSSNSRSRNSRGRKSNNKNQEKFNFDIDQPHFKTILEFVHEISKKISSISISYKYSTKNNFSNILADFQPSYTFKLGFEENPFEDENITNYISNSGSIYTFTNIFNQELRFNTTLQLSNNLSISNLEYKISLSANNQSTTGYNETKVYSYFPAGATGIDGIPIFNWSINYRGIEKYGFLKNWFKTITLNHNYSGERTETLAEGQVQKIDYRRSFAPLIGIKIIPKNSPLNINVNFNNTLNINNTGDQTERKTSEQINIKFDYRKDGGLQIPIFFLRDFEIENNVNLSLTMGYDRSKTDFSYVFTENLSDFETTAFSNTFNIKPEITYSFSKYIDGNFYFNYSVTETHTTGRKKQTDLGFKIKILFESFN